MKAYWTKNKQYGRNLLYKYVSPPKPDQGADTPQDHDREEVALEGFEVGDDGEFQQEATRAADPTVEDGLRKEELEINMDYIDNHVMMGRYSVDFRKCLDPNCCKPYRAPIVKEMLQDFGGMLLSYSYRQGSFLQ